MDLKKRKLNHQILEDQGSFEEEGNTWNWQTYMIGLSYGNVINTVHLHQQSSWYIWFLAFFSLGSFLYLLAHFPSVDKNSL